MIHIEDIFAYEILDSRGNPTIKTRVTLSDGSVGTAIVPSGASTGKKEALELRDKDNRFLGKGVTKAIKNVNEIIADNLNGFNPFNQSKIDEILLKLDSTNNYSNLGANAVLGVSMAVAKASAKSKNMELFRYLGGINASILPIPMFNIINGGVHANNSVDFQEFMIMPTGFNSYKEGLRAVCEIYATLKNILNEEGFATSVGDEGGFAPNLNDNEEPIKYILRAIEVAGYKAGEEIKIALDVAASELYKDGKYIVENKEMTSTDMINYYEKLINKYPIYSIEDGLSEDDWEGFKELTNKLGNRIKLIGDDIFVTNEEILKRAIKEGVANSILIKLNQIGTLTQTLKTIRLAKRKGYTTVISHRSGESEDSFIADLAVGINAGFIKTGAPCRSERTAKYNRLLEIELMTNEYLGNEI